jgi:hypothetical protein
MQVTAYLALRKKLRFPRARLQSPQKQNRFFRGFRTRAVPAGVYVFSSLVSVSYFL